VTFTAYINWAFVETAEAHSLYVNYGDGEQLLSAVTVTAGSSSQTVTDSHGFTSTGTRNVVFTLKDSTGAVVKTVQVPITVGQQSQSTNQSTSQETGSLVSMVSANWELLAIAAALVVVGYVYMGGKEEPSRSGRRSR